jgi:hypothetical protein
MTVGPKRRGPLWLLYRFGKFLNGCLFYKIVKKSATSGPSKFSPNGKHVQPCLNLIHMRHLCRLRLEKQCFVSLDHIVLPPSVFYLRLTKSKKSSNDMCIVGSV